jgi:hypothetical protein
MYYLFDCAAHDLYGPFIHPARAHAMAQAREIGAYQLVTEDERARTLASYEAIRVKSFTIPRRRGKGQFNNPQSQYA